MRKNVIKRLVIVVAGVALVSGCGLLKRDRVIAVFNGGRVTESEVKKIYSAIQENRENLKDKSFEMLPQTDKNLLVQEAIVRRLIELRAKQLKIDTDEKFQNAEKSFRLTFFKNELFQREVDAAATDAAVRQYYDTLVKQLVDSHIVRVRHILVKDRREAENILQLILRNQVGFEAAAREVSMDRNTAEKGGDLGVFVVGAKPTAFEQAILALHPGELSQPVQTKFGWHILRLEEKRRAEIPSFESVKDKLKVEFVQRKREEYVKSLVEKSKLKYIEGQPAIGQKKG